MPLSKGQRIGEIVALRTKLKTNIALRREIQETLAATFRKHGIKLDPDFSPDLIFALPEEIADALSDVILPGGTNCS